MRKAVQLAALAVFLAPLACASSTCPVMLVSGAGARDTISVTFRNLGKLPIRRLEFNCRRVNARAGKAERSHCYEPNVSFLPRTEYTLQYGYPDGKGPVLVSLKSVMFSDGRTWKPSRRDPCRTLKILPPRTKLRRNGWRGYGDFSMITLR
jgi:hypothetical protein